MTTLCVMQPTYLPWIGYFDLIRQADSFVFLDNVAFSKQSWQQRNRIKTPNGLQWLTVPVQSKGKLGQRISETLVDSRQGFAAKHLKALELNYGRAPFFHSLFPGVQAAYEGHKSLAELNLALIGVMVAELGLRTPLYRASALPVEGDRSGRLVALARYFGCTRYLTTPGALDYLRGDKPLFDEAGIEIVVHRYEHPEYPQLFPPFAPYAAALDLLFNVGGEAAAHTIAGGARASVPITSA